MSNSAATITEQEASCLSALIDSSSNAIITFSADGVILSWNHAAELIFGAPKRDVIGRSLSAVDLGQARLALGHVVQVARSRQPVLNWEVGWLRDDRWPITLMVTLSPVMDGSGRVEKVLCIAADITERRQLVDEMLARQRAEAALQEREALAQELHDNLSQNLSFVQMQVATVREQLGRGQVEAADALLQRLAEVSLETQAYIRDQIRTLFRAPRQPGLLEALRDHLRQFCQDLPPERPVRIEARLPDDGGELHLSPDVELHVLRIIQEALANARKHSGASRIWVILDANPEEVRVAVEDDGCGFDPGQVLAGGQTHFGVRIMQQRANLIGGSLVMESCPGSGTRVAVRVPRRRPAARPGQ